MALGINLTDLLQTPPKSEGIFLFKGGKWNYVSDSQKTPLATYEETAQKIIENSGEVLKSKFGASFVEKFNAAWTEARLVQKVIASHKKGDAVIQFNSCNQYAWLSNFFKTLIIDKSNGCILPHVEAGYVAFKAKKAGNSALAESAAKTFDPKHVKQAGAKITRESVGDAVVLQEMERLVRLKFQQNAVLQKLLIASRDLGLEEHTTDTFWGTANGTLYTDDSNHLGKIIVKIRKNYVS